MLVSLRPIDGLRSTDFRLVSLLLCAILRGDIEILILHCDAFKLLLKSLNFRHVAVIVMNVLRRK